MTGRRGAANRLPAHQPAAQLCSGPPPTLAGDTRASDGSCTRTGWLSQQALRERTRCSGKGPGQTVKAAGTESELQGHAVRHGCHQPPGSALKWGWSEPGRAVSRQVPLRSRGSAPKPNATCPLHRRQTTAGWGVTLPACRVTQMALVKLSSPASVLVYAATREF